MAGGVEYVFDSSLSMYLFFAPNGPGEPFFGGCPKSNQEANRQHSIYTYLHTAGLPTGTLFLWYFVSIALRTVTLSFPLKTEQQIYNKKKNQPRNSDQLHAIVTGSTKRYNAISVRTIPEHAEALLAAYKKNTNRILSPWILRTRPRKRLLLWRSWVRSRLHIIPRKLGPVPWTDWYIISTHNQLRGDVHI